MVLQLPALRTDSQAVNAGLVVPQHASTTVKPLGMPIARVNASMSDFFVIAPDANFPACGTVEYRVLSLLNKVYNEEGTSNLSSEILRTIYMGQYVLDYTHAQKVRGAIAAAVGFGTGALVLPLIGGIWGSIQAKQAGEREKQVMEVLEQQLHREVRCAAQRAGDYRSHKLPGLPGAMASRGAKAKYTPPGPVADSPKAEDVRSKLTDSTLLDFSDNSGLQEISRRKANQIKRAGIVRRQMLNQEPDRELLARLVLEDGISPSNAILVHRLLDKIEQEQQNLPPDQSKSAFLKSVYHLCIENSLSDPGECERIAKDALKRLKKSNLKLEATARGAKAKDRTPGPAADSPKTGDIRPRSVDDLQVAKQAARLLEEGNQAQSDFRVSRAYAALSMQLSSGAIGASAGQLISSVIDSINLEQKKPFPDQGKLGALENVHRMLSEGKGEPSEECKRIATSVLERLGYK